MKHSILLFSNTEKISHACTEGIADSEKIFPECLTNQNKLLKYDAADNYFKAIDGEFTPGIYAVFDEIKFRESNTDETYRQLKKIDSISEKVVLVFHSLPKDKEKIKKIFGSKAIEITAEHEIPTERNNKLDADDNYFYFKVYNVLVDLHNRGKGYFNGTEISSVAEIINLTIESLDKITDLEKRLKLLHLCLSPKGIEEALSMNMHKEIGLDEKLLSKLSQFSDPFSNDYLNKLTEIRDKVLGDNFQ